MSLFNESSIRKRLYLAFACMWAIMIFFAFFRGQQLNTVMVRYNEAMNTINTRQRYIGSIVTALNKLRFDDLAVGALLNYPNMYDRLVLSNRDEYINSLRQYLFDHRTLVVNDPLLTENQKLEHISINDQIYYVLNRHYIPASNALMEAIETGNDDIISYAFYLNFTLGAHLQEMVWELRDKTFDFAAYITETMRDYDGADERMFNIATMIGITIAILLAVVLAETTQKPISQLRFAVSEVAAGNMQHPIRMKYTDDIGRLSHDVANMVESISEMINTDAEQKNRIEQERFQKEIIKQTLEETQAASKAKSAFIANTNHEIRTPMNSIIGYTELALDTADPNETKEYLGHVMLSAKHLLNIINGIMDFSKIESGNIELEEIPFSMEEVLEHCRSLMQPTASGKNIELNINAQLPKDRHFVGDPTKLGQIMINLISNAVKFTHVGSVTLAITHTKLESSQYSITFSVKDTGIGMTQSQLDKIFEPFTQADSSTTRKYGGTGLGLAISKRWIEAMGGELYVESTLNKGSEFSFKLSFETIKSKEFSSFIDDGTNIDIKKPNFNGNEILLVDDNAMNLKVGATHFQRVGLVCYVAKNGKEAVEMVKRKIEEGEKPFELIFMDIHMPEMDGIEAAGIITNLNTGVPIIAMTADVLSLTERSSYEDCGMKGYIGKPFTSQELWRCLMKYLGAIDN